MLCMCVCVCGCVCVCVCVGGLLLTCMLGCSLCVHVCSETHVTTSVVIVNVYCPRAEPGNAERLLYKLRFYRLLQLRAEAILASGR